MKSRVTIRVVAVNDFGIAQGNGVLVADSSECEDNSGVVSLMG